MSKPLFAALLAAFANEVGAGPSKRIVLLLDNAGFHTRPNLAVPDGIRLVYLPPYSPELQPAETLWTLVDDPRRADLVTVHDEPCRGKLDRHSSTRHAIRPSLAEAATPLESLGIHRLLHQVRARAKVEGGPATASTDPSGRASGHAEQPGPAPHAMPALRSDSPPRIIELNVAK